MNKAVFLDRDGTINSDRGHYYIENEEDFIFNPGAIDAIKLLNEQGYLVIVITNQGGIAKGLYTEKTVHKIHNYMCSVLETHGAHIDDIYYCPHHESVSPCNCRKPSPYMIEQACIKHNIDKSLSVMIGDAERDIQSAEAAGVKGILISKNSNLLPVIEEFIK